MVLHPSPLKRNLVPRFTNGGGKQKKQWRTLWLWRREVIRIIRWRRTSWSPMPPFLLCVGNISPCRIWLRFMTLLVWRLITRSSWFNNSSGSSDKKRTSSKSNVKGDILHPGKNFQKGSIISVIEDDILFDNRLRWIHEATCEIKMTWLEGGPTPCKVLARRWTNMARW
jgi:hypothetical protein